MASPITAAISTTLTEVKAIPYVWADVTGAEKVAPTLLFQKVLVWNDQVKRMKEGKGYFFSSPACFVEFVPEATTQLLENVTMTEVCWRFHIVDMRLNELDETGMDENLEVFKYRDLVKQYMVGFQPDNCSTMYFKDERQDYEHTDVYHYIVECRTCFTDDKGSILDPDQVRYIFKSPPTNLEMITEFDDGINPPVDPVTSYIWEVYEILAEIVDIPDPDATQILGNGVEIPLQYAINMDGTITIPYLTTTEGIQVVAPFIIDGNIVQNVVYVDGAGIFDNSASGGFVIGNKINFNASLPNL